MPVGSEQAARFYAECALEAGVAFINNMPVFIASNPEFAERFKRAQEPADHRRRHQIAARRDDHPSRADRSCSPSAASSCCGPIS